MQTENQLKIRAEIWSDDHVFESNFNALPFFLSANDTYIRKLIECEWGGDYAADEVALSCKNDVGVKSVFDYCDLYWKQHRKSIGFEVRVNSHDALAWLWENRPSLMREMQKEGHDVEVSREEYTIEDFMQFLMYHLEKKVGQKRKDFTLEIPMRGKVFVLDVKEKIE